MFTIYKMGRPPSDALFKPLSHADCVYLRVNVSLPEVWGFYAELCGCEGRTIKLNSLDFYIHLRQS